MVQRRFRTFRFLQVAALAFVFTPSVSASENVLVDRLLLEVNGMSYSQRQMEIYHLIRQAIDLEIDQPLIVLARETWLDALHGYRDAMVIDHEVQRLGSFRPAKAAIDLAEKIIRTRNEQDERMQELMERLEIGGRTLRQNVAMNLRIEAFRQNKDRPMQNQLGRIASGPAWLEELRLRTQVRVFEGAEEFVPIVRRTK